MSSVLSLVFPGLVRRDGFRMHDDAANYAESTIVLYDIGPVLAALRRGAPAGDKDQAA